MVVVGGGFGGIAAAQKLKSSGLSFTLIDLRDAFHHNVASLRAAVKPGFAVRTFIPFRDTFGDSFVQGRVVAVNTDKQSVLLSDGTELQYSHLILCTGTEGPFPGKFNTEASYERAVQAYEDMADQVRTADSVLVVGGGSSGVELAAEVISLYPEKKVVLIHSRPVLTDIELLPCVRNQAKEVLLEKGVEILLSQKVLNLKELPMNKLQRNITVVTDKGQSLSSDLILDCTGLKVNSSAYSSAFSTALAPDGALKVNPQLQVEGFSNVFAVGDCAHLQEPKMAYHAALHAAVAVSNILHSLSGTSLESYSTGRVTMLLALGADDGVGQFSGVRLPRSLVALGKSRDLLLWKSWREMGQRQPQDRAQLQ